MIGRAFAVVASLLLMASAEASDSGIGQAPELRTLLRDPALSLRAEPAVSVLEGGLLPTLFCSKTGTLVCQAVVGRDTETSKAGRPGRGVGFAVSRDGGRTWTDRGRNPPGLSLSGGVLQTAAGPILALDTYVLPNSRPDEGVGGLWRSEDDFRTITQAGAPVFHLPSVQFSGSTDDGGHRAGYARIWRSLLELPGGDLLATLYCQFAGDTAPCGYLPSMMKSRAVLVRSSDGGRTWSYQSTIAMDGAVGTEGFVEPVLVRVSHPAHQGRLICLMRTGREMYRASSDDNGRTWTLPRPLELPGIDILRTEKWAGLFLPPGSPPREQMLGALVDPDLIEMSDGTLVCAVGARIPAKGFKENPNAPGNGNYLAFSRDGGDHWSEVVEFWPNRPGTHYLGVREVQPGVLYVVFDNHVWGHSGQTLGFRLKVTRLQ